MKCLLILWLFFSTLMPAFAGETKQYTFYTDTHIGSKYMAMNILPFTPAQINKENAYDLGDSYELKNCEPHDYFYMKAAWENHKKLFKNRFVSGNHSVDKGLGPINLIIDDHILLTHGDYPLWDIKKRIEYRANPMCTGSGLKQLIASKFHGKVSDSEAEQLSYYAFKYSGIDTIVIGHVHPKYVFDEIVNGIRVIVLPRGKTILEL